MKSTWVGTAKSRNAGVDHGNPQIHPNHFLRRRPIQEMGLRGKNKKSMRRRARYARLDSDPGMIRDQQSAPVTISPSDNLIAALGPVGHCYETPEQYQSKLDLSSHDPMVVSRYGRSRIRPARSSVPGIGARIPITRKGLQLLLAKYVKYNNHFEDRSLYVDDGSRRSDDQGNQLLQVFDSQSMELLDRQGYGPEDVVMWAWILKAESADIAAARLWAVANRPDLIQPRTTPMFLYLFLLRRHDWNAAGVKLMLSYAWRRAGGRKVSARARGREYEFKPVSLPQKMQAMIAFVRLLRLARKVFPEACVSIAALFDKHMISKYGESQWGLVDGRSRARLTFLYNTALSLLSHPSSMRPYQSVIHQQRAQFNLIRSMNDFQPPLAIDREGYRAVTRIQLAHRKTEQEADWAAMKAKSWPPWKEDRLGLDADKGPEYGTSRARKVISKMEEAGYAAAQWDESACVLAGWDTDQSPTIQTRMFISKSPMSRHAAVSREMPVTDGRNSVWAARIRATRTIDEAWACFLAYKGEKSPRNEEVYYAMSEKIIFEKNRLKKIHKAKSQVTDASSAEENMATFPGDSPQVYAKPSPQEAIYVPSSPPDFNAFFDLTLEHKIRPSGRFLAFILKHAASFGAGIQYLAASALPPRVAEALLTEEPMDRDRILQDIRYTSDHTFAAFIHFLTRFAPRQSDEKLPILNWPNRHLNDDHAGVSKRHVNPLHQAFRLLLARKPFYRPPWNSVLSKLANAGVSVGTYEHSKDLGLLKHPACLSRYAENPQYDRMSDLAKSAHAQDILSWIMIRSVLRQMGEIGLELDFALFQIVCVGLEKAISAATTSIATSSPARDDDTLQTEAMDVLNNGHIFVKGLFKHLVANPLPGLDQHHVEGDDEPAPETGDLLPRLLEVPAPGQLHAFIRVLGLREDFAGLRDLIEWMSRFAPELQIVVDEAANGQRILRRCLVATRVFLEQRWVSMGQRAEKDENAPQTPPGQAGDQSGMPAHGQQHDPVSGSCSSEIIDRVRSMVEQTEQWGDWPTDEEVEAYCVYRRG